MGKETQVGHILKTHLKEKTKLNSKIITQIVLCKHLSNSDLPYLL